MWPHAIRARGNPTSLMASVRREVHGVARDEPISLLETNAAKVVELCVFFNGLYQPLQERAMGLEPTTSSLGSWHSTN